MKKTYHIRSSGFTLVELIIVITIIGILATLGFANYQTSMQRARDGKRKADLEQIRSALEMCRTDSGSYPGSLTFGGTLTCSGNTYMNPVPVDPQKVHPQNASPWRPYVYTYSGGGNSYTLCANQLEIEGTSYCVSNP